MCMLDLVEVEYFPVHTTQRLSSDQNMGVQSLWCPGSGPWENAGVQSLWRPGRGPWEDAGVQSLCNLGWVHGRTQGPVTVKTWERSIGGRRGPVTVTTWEGSMGRCGGPVNVTTWEGSMGRRRGLVIVTTREGSTLGCKVQLAVQPLPSLSIPDMSVSSDTNWTLPCQLLDCWPQKTCAKLCMKSILSADTTVKSLVSSISIHPDHVCSLCIGQIATQGWLLRVVSLWLTSAPAVVRGHTSSKYVWPKILYAISAKRRDITACNALQRLSRKSQQRMQHPVIHYMTHPILRPLLMESPIHPGTSLLLWMSFQPL